MAADQAAGINILDSFHSFDFLQASSATLDAAYAIQKCGDIVVGRIYVNALPDTTLLAFPHSLAVDGVGAPTSTTLSTSPKILLSVSVIRHV